MEWLKPCTKPTVSSDGEELLRKIIAASEVTGRYVTTRYSKTPRGIRFAYGLFNKATKRTETTSEFDYATPEDAQRAGLATLETSASTFVADQLKWVEAMRALTLSRELPTAPLDELLFSLIALQREITGEAVGLIPADWGTKPLA